MFITLPLRGWRKADAGVVGGCWSVSQAKMVSNGFNDKPVSKLEREKTIEKEERRHLMSTLIGVCTHTNL